MSVDVTELARQLQRKFAGSIYESTERFYTDIARTVAPLISEARCSPEERAVLEAADKLVAWWEARNIIALEQPAVFVHAVTVMRAAKAPPKRYHAASSHNALGRSGVHDSSLQDELSVDEVVRRLNAEEGRAHD